MSSIFPPSLKFIWLMLIFLPGLMRSGLTTGRHNEVLRIMQPLVGVGRIINSEDLLRTRHQSLSNWRLMISGANDLHYVTAFITHTRYWYNDSVRPSAVSDIVSRQLSLSQFFHFQTSPKFERGQPRLWRWIMKRYFWPIAHCISEVVRDRHTVSIRESVCSVE